MRTKHFHIQYVGRVAYLMCEIKLNRIIFLVIGVFIYPEFCNFAVCVFHSIRLR